MKSLSATNYFKPKPFFIYVAWRIIGYFADIEIIFSEPA